MNSFRILRAIFLLIAAVFFIYLGGHDILLGFSSSAWQTTKGRVLTSYVKPSIFGRSPSSPKISYQYQVDGHEYEGNKVCASGDLNFYDAYEWAHNYPAGADVLVYYDPNKPNESLLKPGIRLEAFVVLLAACLMLIFGIYDIKQARSEDG